MGRINAGWMKCLRIIATTWSRRFPHRLKGNIYKTIIPPDVMYESKYWSTKALQNGIYLLYSMHVSEMRILRWREWLKVSIEYIRGNFFRSSSGIIYWKAVLVWAYKKQEGRIARKMMSMKVLGYTGREAAEECMDELRESRFE